MNATPVQIAIATIGIIILIRCIVCWHADCRRAARERRELEESMRRAQRNLPWLVE